MACALTHDDPVGGCRDRGWIPVLLRVGAVVAGLSLVPLVLVPGRRRASAPPVARNG